MLGLIEGETVEESVFGTMEASRRYAKPCH